MPRPLRVISSGAWKTMFHVATLVNRGSAHDAGNPSADIRGH